MRLMLNDDFADRVICQGVLWTLTNPRKAVREMIRVCRPGGLVCAIEGAFDSVVFDYPENERLSELSTKALRLNARGYKRLYGLDRGIGYKLPSLFDELGLERVRLDAYAYSWLEADDRIPTDYKFEFHRRDLDGMKHQSKRYEEALMAGGMSRKEIGERDRLYVRHLKKLISEPDSIGKDFSTTAGIWFITTGIKGPKNRT
jgi:SAM-dependent methyltransferase